MAETGDTIRSLVDGHNGLLEYLRKLVLLIPSADLFTPDMLPDRIEQQEDSPAASWPPEEVIPLPRTQVVDEGYMLSGEDEDGAQAIWRTFRHHYAAQAGSVTEEPFYTLADSLNCAIEIGVTAARCYDDTSAGGHPNSTTTRLVGAPLAGVARGNVIETELGSADWLSLAYTAIGTDGTDLGHGVAAITGLDIQFNCSTAGLISIRINNQTGVWGQSLSINFVLLRVRYPDAPGDSEGGANSCHENPPAPGSWGDGIWTPG